MKLYYSKGACSLAVRIFICSLLFLRVCFGNVSSVNVDLNKKYTFDGNSITTALTKTQYPYQITYTNNRGEK